MPSKKVFIKCKQAFIHEHIRSEAAMEQLSFSKRGIGSYFANKHISRKGTGLTDEELKLLLPQILDVRADDLEFRKKVDLFYTDINTVVPYGDKGLELEVGLELDNSKPVTYFEEEGEEGKKVKKYNTPIDFEAYIRYRHALKHPHVAGTPGDAKGNGTVHYYVEDPEAVQDAQVAMANLKDEAILSYNQIKDDNDKVNMFLTLLRGDIKKKIGEIVVVSQFSNDRKKIELRKIAEHSPEKFMKYFKDEQVKYKYLLDELVSTQLLRRAGQSIILAENNEPIGSNEQEAIDNLFKNVANSGLLTQLKAQYKERKTVSTGVKIQ